MEPMYKFKDSVSTEERANVMKIIKYNKLGLVYASTLEQHPELKEYFEPALGGKDE